MKALSPGIQLWDAKLKSQFQVVKRLVLRGPLTIFFTLTCDAIGNWILLTHLQPHRKDPNPTRYKMADRKQLKEVCIQLC
jgi:hypothetical protein